MKKLIIPLALLTLSTNIYAGVCQDLTKKINHAEKYIALKDNSSGDTVHHGTYDASRQISLHSNVQVNLLIMQLNGCKYKAVFDPNSYALPAAKCRLEIAKGNYESTACKLESWEKAKMNY